MAVIRDKNSADSDIAEIIRDGVGYETNFSDIYIDVDTKGLVVWCENSLVFKLMCGTNVFDSGTHITLRSCHKFTCTDKMKNNTTVSE